jgi:hypothetical protein
MALPKIHSYTWSDTDSSRTGQSVTRQLAPDRPTTLTEKELHLWVTYPKIGKKKSKRKSVKTPQFKRSLWAVVVIEALEKVSNFTYEVTLRRIYKKDERIIRVWVANDPSDQSEDAAVFSVISPRLERLDALEQQLSKWAAKRVYDAIVQEWPEPAHPV